MAAGSRPTERYMYPRGRGGMLGHIGRMIVMVLTFGFVFPNAFIEGMNMQDMDNNAVSKSEAGKGT